MSVIIKDLSFKYNPKQKPILNNINLEIGDGEIIALLGTSGSGKSTLLNIISSLYQPTSGTINLININELELSYLQQSAIDMVFPWKTVIQNIEFALKERNQLTVEAKNRIENLLSVLKLNHRKNYFPNQLSGGEIKRLSFACGLSYLPKLILLDEAFSGVDLSLKLKLWEFLKNEIANNKASSVIISHDFDEAIFLADRIIFLDKNGTIHSKQLLIDRELKENLIDLEQFFSNKKIVEIKKEALSLFRKINDDE